MMKRANPATGASHPSSPGSKRQKTTTSSKKNGHGITNGFADPLRNYGDKSYKPGERPEPPSAKITRPLGKNAGSAKNPHLPTRDAKSAEFRFPDFPDFRPNLSPAEVIRLGSFGGTYYRDIFSTPTNKVELGASALGGLPVEAWGWRAAVGGATSSSGGGATTSAANDKFSHPRVGVSPSVNKPPKVFCPDKMLTSSVYRVEINRFGVKCGGSLDMWESSGWISPIDPFGWFQWYCRFFLGRRSTDDDRQVKRWLAAAGPKGRFKNQLLNKCENEKKKRTDVSVSPVIRQTLQHWGLEVK